MNNFIFSFMVLFLISCTFLPAQRSGTKVNSLGEPSYTRLNLNNISTAFYNNGMSDINPDMNSGFFYLKGSGKNAIYASGLIWVAKAPDLPQIRANGSTYGSGMQGGRIISPGVPEDPNLPHVHIYRVRPDVYPGGPPVDLSVEAQDEGKTEAEIRAQYELDWNEWRAIDGAPFKDVNGNGTYEPSIDIPGVDGAAQTIWFVMNDLDSSYLFGAPPIGIEVQETIWEYKNAGFLDNLFFRKYKLINKSTTLFNDMYLSMWSDVDLGYPFDNFAGCDTLLNLVYSYNGGEYDAVYAPFPPPAVGFKLIKGPLDPNGIPLPMTCAYYFSSNGPWYEPSFNYTGTVMLYWYLQGKYLTGNHIINAITGLETNYFLSGDPLTGEGWVDGYLYPAGDRHIGLVSGPFQMASGDTQEVVIAEIAGLGTNRINSFRSIKYYAARAQDVYNNGLVITYPPKPLTPEVVAYDTGWVMKFDWGQNISLVQQIENFNQDGYEFQGYNVYQLPSPDPISESAVKVATFDKIDGITTIPGIIMDPETGLPVNGNLQNGTDSGIQREFSTRHDYIDNSTMIIGKKYYFAVTAYTYNPDQQAVPRSTESVLQTFEVEYMSGASGANYGDSSAVIHSAGDADGNINVTVANPAQLTGSNYEVYFDDQTYYRNEDGEWIPIGRKDSNCHGETDDLTGSYLSGAAVYGSTAGSIELRYDVFIIDSITGDWADGVKLTFPPSISIINALPCKSNNDGSWIIPLINHTNNTVFYGNDNQDENGAFAGGEEIIINVSSYTLPLAVDYIIYDDNYGGTYQNAEGTVTINSIGYAFKTQHEWNLRNLTTQDTLLRAQTVINGYDLYTKQYAGAPVVEGIMVNPDISYDAPGSIGGLQLNGEPLKIDDHNADYDITDFSIFGYDPATAANTLPVYGGAGGTTNILDLQQDYQLRWTGILADTTINGITITITQSGGQLVTLFGASGYDLADHPLNPNPGLNEPFTLRVPFEVWNVNKHEQVNALFWDRSGDPTGGGLVWNTEDREYLWCVNIQYSTDVIDPVSSIVADSATWNWVIFKSHFTTGDTIDITYNNPVRPGIDLYTFNSPEQVNSIQNVPLLKDYALSQNYPNPFNPATNIIYKIPRAGNVELKVYDILGRQVAVLVNGYKNAGTYTVNFNGRRFASGVYIYRLISGNFVSVKKMVLLK
jgi:hypothetical protein